MRIWTLPGPGPFDAMDMQILAVGIGCYEPTPTPTVHDASAGALALNAYRRYTPDVFGLGRDVRRKEDAEILQLISMILPIILE